MLRVPAPRLKVKPPVEHRPVEIVAQGVHKWFGGNHVLRGVDLTVGRGEIVAIVGGSGCGKTVLLEHMAGLDPHFDGSYDEFSRSGSPVIRPYFELMPAIQSSRTVGP